ncbi:hypothetical protein GTQ99_18530 [Kineococcus sp. T13]|uniref:hypothetical protein n=1 Tax=Kineococcus vitellinus TaxID=2696565 RepID=UPI0014135A64|nr:hypothetical protein [Kineococcus vitellinus]NAZ77403.1 hypothetical protein [Kineococcus vitellinus]
MSLVQPAAVEPGPPAPPRAGARLTMLLTVGAVLVSGAVVVRHAVEVSSVRRLGGASRLVDTNLAAGPG